MEQTLLYIVKVVALQCMLFLLYRLFASRHHHFQFNRYFLLAILILPFIIPLFSIPISIFPEHDTGDGIVNPWFFIEQSLPNVIIAGNRSAIPQLPAWALALIILYLLIMIPTGIHLLYDYFKIIKIGRKCSKQEYSPKGYKTLYIKTPILSFSFLNRIFLSDLFPLQKHEKKTIITHEEYHLTELHTLDILLAELIRVVCWFNPVVHFIQKNLKETHEYLADRHTLRTTGQNDYATLLRSFKRQEIQMILGSGYTGASIKKRLRMIESKKANSSVGAVFLLCVLAIATGLLFACDDKLDSFDHKDEVYDYVFTEADLQEEIASNLAYLSKAPESFLNIYQQKQLADPSIIYLPRVSLQVTEEAATAEANKLKENVHLGGLTLTTEFFRKLTQEELEQYLGVDQQLPAPVAKSGFLVLRKTDRLKYMDYLRKMQTLDNKIHTDFDKGAEFKGGIAALASFLHEHLKYPAIAREKGIEDQLVMRFVVTKQGGLVYLNIAKEPQTDNEEVSLEFQKAAYYALRETEGMWKPAEKDGSYVMSKMTLPIQFRLDGKKENE